MACTCVIYWAVKEQFIYENSINKDENRNVDDFKKNYLYQLLFCYHFTFYKETLANTVQYTSSKRIWA